MKKSRLLAFVIALLAAGGAFYLMFSKPPPPQQQIVVAPPPVEEDAVLVAAKELTFGMVVADGDMAWQPWPKKNVGAAMIRKSEKPNAMNDIKGSIVRGAFLPGEPLRTEKLFKGQGSGYLSTVVAPGHRAVAINIEGSGATTAGNFILPNDHVDVIRIYRDEDAAKSGAGDAYVSETLVTNVRVLAIGQNAQDRGGQPNMNGATATLELDPRQAEMVILAQRVGQLSLVLRSMTDSVAQSDGSEPPPVPETRDKGVTIVRFGVATQSRGK